MDKNLRLEIIGYDDELLAPVENRRPMPIHIGESDFQRLGEHGVGVPNRLEFADTVVFCRDSVPWDHARCSEATLHRWGMFFPVGSDGKVRFCKGLPIVVDESVTDGDFRLFRGDDLRVSVTLGV